MEGGTIMDPKSGKVYDCYLNLEDPNTLKVRGFLGFSFFPLFCSPNSLL